MGTVNGERTVGCMVPEILRGKLGTTTVEGVETLRLIKSVDIFALVCLYYYYLTSGQHQFGHRFNREASIVGNKKSLDGLKEEEIRGDSSEAER